MKRLKKNIKQDQTEKCASMISKFANQGLRVLMIGKKTMSVQEFKNFELKLKEAELDHLNKALRVEKVIEELEQDFELVGATVVEDKLQDEVPETIMRLKLAGIKVWMLTGDSFDTAKNIGISCSLLNCKEKIFEVCGERGDKIEEFFNEYDKFVSKYPLSQNQSQLNNLYSNIRKINDNPFDQGTVKPELVDNNNINLELKESKDKNTYLLNDKNNMFYANKFEIVIDRVSLAHVFKDELTSKKFLEIASQANSVICCRVSPMQKAQIVSEMKKFDRSAKTLAIGDGGNDVSMILEANIGIGVYGEEGMRAVQASDYSIGEFKILQRLLFFHGRINLFRMSKMIYYFFYKNFIFTISHFLYLFFCSSSGQPIFEDWFITFYNLIYTAIPIGILTCSDIDIRDEDGEIIKMTNPFLYRESRDKPDFTKMGFVYTMLLGCLICLQQFFFIIFALDSETTIDIHGNTADIWTVSFAYFATIYFFMTISIMIRIRYHTLIFHLGILITSFLPFALTIIWFHNSVATNSSSSYTTILKSPKFYLTVIVNIAFGVILEMCLRAWEFSYSKKTTNVMQTIRKNLPSIDQAQTISPFKEFLEEYKNIDNESK